MAADEQEESPAGQRGTFTLELLHLIKEAQAQHGLRHGDFQRYRSYCSRRIRRVRKSLHFVNSSHKHRFTQKKVSVEVINDIKFLYLPLVNAERAWGYAMQLKQEANTEPRKRYHLINKLRKAVKHAEDLEHICESDKCDARTKLEAQAYAAWMRGTLQFEKNDWQNAMDSFTKTKTIYKALCDTLPPDQRGPYEQRENEILPNLRYCAYNLGDQMAMEDLLEMRRKGAGEGLANIDHLIQQTREKQAVSLSSVVTLSGVEVAVTNEKLRLAMLTVDDTRNELRSLSTPQDDPQLVHDRNFELLERNLMEVKDALQIVRDEIRLDPKTKQSQQWTSLQLLESHLRQIRLETQVERNLLLFDTLTKGDAKAKKVPKPGEVIRLLDNIIQNLTDIPTLPGHESNKQLAATFNTRATGFRAHKCYYIAVAYSQVKKWPETIALCDRVLKYIDEATRGFKKVNDQLFQKEVQSLSDLHKETESCRYAAHASSILDVSDVTDKMSRARLNNKALINRLEEYWVDPSLGARAPSQPGGAPGGGGGGGGAAVQTKKTSPPAPFVHFPPDFTPIPAKPLFFDLALNHVVFPALEARVEQKKAGGGITGFVKGWLWGGEKK